MAGFIPRSVPLPGRLRKIQDPATAQQFQETNYAIQAAQSNTATALAQLNATQIQFGSFTFSGPLSVTVTFNAPFVDAGYALLLSPAIQPASIVKTATGFTITLDSVAPGYPLDWLAVH